MFTLTRDSPASALVGTAIDAPRVVIMSKAENIRRIDSTSLQHTVRCRKAEAIGHPSEVRRSTAEVTHLVVSRIAFWTAEPRLHAALGSAVARSILASREEPRHHCRFGVSPLP